MPIHQHLLLRGRLLVKLPLAGILVISLMGARLSVDDSGLAEKLLRVAHLAWDANLRDEAAVHGLGLRIGHCHLLWLHVLLLLLMGLILVHAWATTGSPARVNWLAQLVHTVSVRAIVRIRASLARIEVLAHDRFVVLEAACASLSLVATTAVTALIAATSATPALPARPLKGILTITSVHTTTHASAILGVHASTSTTTHLIVAVATTRGASWTIVSSAAWSQVAVASASTEATASTTWMVLFTTASVVATASVIATAMVVDEATATWIARTSLALPTGASTALAIAHGALLVGHYTTARLQAQVFRDRIVYVTQFSIAVSILAVLVPLAEAFVLEVATLLSLEALVDRTILDGSIGLLLHHLLWLSWSTHLRLDIRLSGLLHLHLLLLLRVHYASHRLLLLLNDGVGILGYDLLGHADTAGSSWAGSLDSSLRRLVNNGVLLGLIRAGS